MVSLSVPQNTVYIMYEVNYNGRTSCVSNYCHVQLKGLSHDAEHDLLATAMFLVINNNNNNNNNRYIYKATYMPTKGYKGAGNVRWSCDSY